jgi:hypothetical protein
MTLSGVLNSPVVQSAEWTSSELDLVCEQVLDCARIDRVLEPHRVIDDALVDRVLQIAGRCAAESPWPMSSGGVILMDCVCKCRQMY